jgi:hypothetical protein
MFACQPKNELGKTRPAAANPKPTMDTIDPFDMDAPEPPPPGYVSDPRLATVTDWLKDIAGGQAPEGRVERFNIGLYTAEKDGQVDYILTLEGMRNDTINGLPHLRLAYQPARNGFFTLPKSRYPASGREELAQAVLPELKAFLQSDAFRTSFLSKAQMITTDFSEPLKK